MTDKKFRNLRRSDLIEIIYEYQKREKSFEEEIENLRKRLSYSEREDKTAELSDAVARLNRIIDAVCTKDSFRG